MLGWIMFYCITLILRINDYLKAILYRNRLLFDKKWVYVNIVVHKVIVILSHYNVFLWDVPFMANIIARKASYWFFPSLFSKFLVVAYHTNYPDSLDGVLGVKFPWNWFHKSFLWTYYFILFFDFLLNMIVET